MPRSNRTHRYIAFLRGINLGKRRLKMDHLCSLFQAMKFSDVSTFLASGNVIFETPAADAAALEKRIEAHLQQALGYPVDTFLRTPADLAAAVASCPFAAEEIETSGHRLHVGFLRAAPADAAVRKLLSMRTAMDDFCVRSCELYWLIRGKTMDSLVSWQVVEKTIAVPSTMRHITTVQKLAAMHPPV
jgi:uncharacterized protein (DUF1697 family)